MQQSPRTVCLPWFDPHSYEVFRASMVGGHRMPASYARWRRTALAIADQVERQGRGIERVPVRPAPFVRWCRKRGVLADAAALDGFARHLLATRDFDTLETDMAEIASESRRSTE